jgi:hypothetical protein
MATVFTPGVSHAHAPSKRWAEVQASPNSSLKLNILCKMMSPRELVGAAIMAEFRDKPIALDHLNWYLAAGRGTDFDEDDNIEKMLREDKTVQAAIRSRFPAGMTRGVFAGHLKVEQDDYTSQDLRFAFGAIDRLDFQVDFTANTIHAWFQDRYEWHPVYPGLYLKFSDDAARETNCVHAALVELKTSGAADFWMKGEATVPLSAIAGSTPSATSSSRWI